MMYSDMKSMLMMVDDPAIRLEMVMDFGKNLSPVPDGAICTEILGCASFVQICRLGNRFYGVADSAIVRGIVAVLLSMVDGMSVQNIKNLNIEEEFNSLNLNLGAARLNGVGSMIRFFKNL